MNAVTIRVRDGDLSPALLEAITRRYAPSDGTFKPFCASQAVIDEARQRLFELERSIRPPTAADVRPWLVLVRDGVNCGRDEEQAFERRLQAIVTACQEISSRMFDHATVGEALRCFGVNPTASMVFDLLYRLEAPLRTRLRQLRAVAQAKPEGAAARA